MIVREKEVAVCNPFGVHGRVATRLALVARQYEVRLHLIHADVVIDCSSVLDVLSMAFASGSTFTVRVAGEEKMVDKTFSAVERLFAAEEEHKSDAEGEND